MPTDKTEAAPADREKLVNQRTLTVEVFKRREDETISQIKCLSGTRVSLRDSPNHMAVIKPVL